MKYLEILFAAIFISNIMFYKLEGFPTISKKTKLKSLMINSTKLAIFTFVSALIVYPLNKYLFVGTTFSFLIPILIVLVLQNVVVLSNKVVDKIQFEEARTNILETFILEDALVVTILLLILQSETYVGALVEVVGYMIGFMLMMLLLYTIKPKLDLPGIPKSFRGFPILLITTGLIAMIFMGLAGIL
ncbi:Rnf-Nqr domain containing protein [Haploplasma modicum]|uniref:Rnf-Nqr domain containing protein n=1 Tax=Haploplasma modicum TaxID=2150 RepID=UPI00214ADBEC|nr:Rnf-Nqr domain containing protein [Haploplasma modicum]MCR1808680.1 hypothetical protein [Haploplasma modicum]